MPEEDDILREYFRREVGSVPQRAVPPPEQRRLRETNGRRSSLVLDLIAYAALILFALLPNLVTLPTPELAELTARLYESYGGGEQAVRSFQLLGETLHSIFTEVPK
jgi:hypothetical protein